MAEQLLAVHLNMEQNQLLNARAQVLAADPGSPVTGQIYYNSTTNKLMWYNGATFVAAEPGTPTLDWGEASELENVTKAAESAGALDEIARIDHKHDVDTATAGSSAPGASAAEGAATSLARSDHAHAREAYAGTSQLADVDAAAEAAGSDASVSRGDHKHAASVGLPAASAPGDAQGAGAADSLARSNHVHAREPYGTTTELADVDAAAEAAGTHASVSRGDHKHALSVGAVTAQTSFGAASGNGSANSASRSDHTHGTPAHGDADHSTVELNDLAAPDGTVSFNNQVLSNLADPSADQDAANKRYVDGVAQGLDVKQSVRVATTAAGTLASSFENGDTIDGQTLATNDRILIKNQAAPEENGIYTVNASGAPTRALDANTWGELISAFVFVEIGTANADTGWVSTVDAGGTLNTTAVTFAQFSGAGTYTGGAGLTLSGTTFAVGAGTGIAVNADDVAVLRTDANGRVPLRYSATYGDGAATSYNIDHNLNSLSIDYRVWRVSDGKEIQVDATVSTVNRLIVAHNVAVASNAMRVVVIG
jgi:hypothetical protein